MNLNEHLESNFVVNLKHNVNEKKNMEEISFDDFDFATVLDPLRVLLRKWAIKDKISLMIQFNDSVQ